MAQWGKTLAMQACLPEFGSWNPCRGGKKEPTPIVKWEMETGSDGSNGHRRGPASMRQKGRPASCACSLAATCVSWHTHPDTVVKIII